MASESWQEGSSLCLQPLEFGALGFRARGFEVQSLVLRLVYADLRLNWDLPILVA